MYKLAFYFYTPVFRRDVLWYGDVRPSVCPSVRVSVRPYSALFSYMLWHIELKFCTWLCFTVVYYRSSFIFIRPSSDGTYYGMVMSVRVSVRPFSALFSYMLWHIELKFCTWLCFTVLQIKFECRHFASILKELCLFVNLEYRLCAVFVTFLLHALTYWAQILHKTLFHRITDQVRVSSIYFNSCGSYAPFGTSNTGNTQFSALFSYMLWHIELKFCIWLCFTVLQIKVECCEFVSIVVGVMPLLELRNTGNTQFSALFSYMLWHIELKFCIWLCFTVLQIKFKCRQFASSLVRVMPLLKLRILEIQCAVFGTFLLHALTYWAEILHKTLFHRITDQVRVSSICINSCESYAPFGTSNTGNTQFSALFSYMLWHIELKVCIWLCFTVLLIKFECCAFASIGVGVMPLLELRILKIHSFPHFSLTCFDILSWNFTYDFV